MPRKRTPTEELHRISRILSRCMSGGTQGRRVIQKDMVFGMLTVKGVARCKRTRNGTRRTYWRCECSCGGEVVVSNSALLSKNTQSCGCIGSENRERMKDFYIPAICTQCSEVYNSNRYRRGWKLCPACNLRQRVKNWRSRQKGFNFQQNFPSTFGHTPTHAQVVVVNQRLQSS